MTWDWPDHPGKKKPASKGGQEFVCFNRRNYPKKSTNGLLVSHVLRIQRVPVLHHHHAKMGQFRIIKIHTWLRG